MELDYVIDRMAANAGIFASLTKGLTAEQVSWKPAPDKWSILEVVNHLYDEEKEDFRQTTPVGFDGRRFTMATDCASGMGYHSRIPRT